MKTDLNSIAQLLDSKTIKEVLVVEIIMPKNNDSEAIHNAIVVKLKNNNLNIVCHERLQSLDALLEWADYNVQSKLPILLVFHGSKVLYKEVEANGEPSERQIATHFPVYDEKAFYYQIDQLSENKYSISLCRKSYIENYLRKMNILERRIISVSVGPFSILKTYKHLLKLSDNNYELITADYSIAIHTDGDLKYELYTLHNEDLLNPPYLLKGSLPNHYVVGYSLATVFFLNKSSAPCLNINDVDENRENFVFNKEIKYFIVRSALAVIILLIISNILFSVYNSKYIQLDSTYQKTLSATDNQQKEIELYNSKFKTLVDNGLILNKTVTSIADQITKDLHKNIYLRRLLIHPEKQMGVQNIEFDLNSIYIEGNCYSTIDLNEWISDLNKIEWIKTVNIVDYNNGVFLSDFKIKISK